MTDIVFSPSGLTVASQAEMLESIRNLYRAQFSDLARVDDPDSIEGRFCAMDAETKRYMGEMLLSVVSSLLPSTAAGEFIKELIKFNGLTQNVKAYSTVILTVTANTGGATIPAGSLVSTEAGVIFATDSEVVLTPSGSDTVGATATVEGALEASAGSVTTILTPIYGWETVTNAAPADAGNLDETAPMMRARRWRAAVGVGLHHPSKIRSALENLPNVTGVALEVNNGTSYLPSGVPPGHIRAIVRGGDAQDIGDVLFGSYVDPVSGETGAGSVAAGIGTWGDEDVICTAEGQTETMHYDEAVDVNIAVRVLISTEAAKYPSNGDTQIKNNIVALFEGNFEINGETVPAFQMDETIYGTRLMSAANAVPGHHVIAIYVGREGSGTPSAVSLDLDISEFPVTDASIITVVHQ